MLCPSVMRRDVIVFLGIVMTLSLRCNGESVYLRGAGASFPANVYRSWAIYFVAFRHKYMSVQLTYDSIGSGGGKEAITQVRPVCFLVYVTSKIGCSIFRVETMQLWFAFCALFGYEHLSALILLLGNVLVT